MFVLKERHSVICPSQPKKRILPALHRWKSTTELLSSGYSYYIVFPSKNRKGFSLLHQPWLLYPSSLKSMRWPTCHIWGHTKCVWVLKTHLWGHRWARIRVSLLCGKRSALSGLCHYKRLHSQLVLCRERGCVCNLPQTMLAMQTGRCLSRGRRGNDSASFFLLSPVVDFPGFLQAGPN